MLKCHGNCLLSLKSYIKSLLKDGSCRSLKDNLEDISPHDIIHESNFDLRLNQACIRLCVLYMNFTANQSWAVSVYGYRNEDLLLSY